jgi:uncharacterized protein
MPTSHYKAEDVKNNLSRAAMYVAEEGDVKYIVTNTLLQNTETDFDQWTESYLKARRNRMAKECPQCKMVTAPVSGQGWTGRTYTVVDGTGLKIPFALFARSNNQSELVSLAVSANCSQAKAKAFFESLVIDNDKIAVVESKSPLANNPLAESLIVDTTSDGRKWLLGAHKRTQGFAMLQRFPEGEDPKDPKEFIMTTFRFSHDAGGSAHKMATALAESAKKRGPVVQFRTIKDETDDCICDWVEMSLPPQYSLVRAVTGPTGNHILIYTGRKAILVPSERAKFVSIISAAKLSNTPLLVQPLPAQDSPAQSAGSSFEKDKAAAEKGVAAAQYNLGVMYENGDGVAKNQAEAAKWYEKAAGQGFGMAQYNLAVMYSEGRGVARSDDTAAKWCQKAAEQGIARAEVWLGDCYDQGRGVGKDQAKAVTWYQRAAGKNDPTGISNLAFAYAKGIGIAQDEPLALTLWRKAAAKGHMESQFNLASMLARGRGGPQNETEAAKWFRSAAEQGHAVAQSTLGSMYATGSGVTKDDVEAVKWYRKAADQGVAEAQYNLGIMLSNGDGVRKDQAAANIWFDRAKKNGFDP